MITPERWQAVKELLDGALQRSPGERSAFLEEACGADAALRAEVESLLAVDDGASVFLEPGQSHHSAPEPVEDPAGPGEALAALRAVLAGRYAIERELGRGGMATVYLARDLKHQRPVALKVLRPELAAALGDALGAERFLREIAIAARLTHPHVLALHDSGAAAGLLYYVMPYVAGESLRRRLQREGTLSVEEAVRIAGEVADALDYAHRQGVVHRDIKPENILLEERHAVVADFGVARAVSRSLSVAGNSAGGEVPSEALRETLTRPGVVVGTPNYMSPEQASVGREVDGRADVYSLGCVVYEMLAGRAPFLGSSAGEVLLRHSLDPVPPLPRPLRSARAPLRAPAPERLERAVTKALAKEPADRFATAGEFAEALAEALAGAPASTSRASATLGAILRVFGAPRSRRRAALVALSLALLGAGVVGLGDVLWQRSHRAGAAAAAVSASTPERAGPKRVAVLPFENVGRPEDEYFADGMADEVRGKLASLPGIVVIARASSSQYEKTRKSPQQIAEELGVGFLLTGTVRWQKATTPGVGGASRVEVSPELVRIAGAGAPTTAWQEPFEAEFKDVFRVQADIADRVAKALDVALSAGERQSLAERPTASFAAYDAYLQGEAIFSSKNDPASFRRAAGYYEQAVALDPTFALAWAKLSRAHTFVYYNGARSTAERKAARASADRALALGPSRPEGHVALGDYYVRVMQDNTRALGQYRLAERLAPTDAVTLGKLADVERRLGRWEDAVRHAQQAAAIDPRSVGQAGLLSYLFLWLRRYPEALAACDRGLALAPASLPLIETKAMIFLAHGDLAQARAVLRSTPKEVEPTALVAFLVNYWDLYWVLDDEQQQLLLRLTPRPFDDNRSLWALSLAETYALRGDSERARGYADTARAAYEAQLKEVPEDAQLHALRGVALAYLSRRAEAVREGRRSVSLVPVARNAFEGPNFQHQLVRIYLLVGEPEKALDELGPLLKIPYYLSPGWLKIDPTFAPLKGNPRFERLVAGG